MTALELAAPLPRGCHDRCHGACCRAAEPCRGDWCIAEGGQNPLNYSFLCDASRIDWTAKAVPLVGPCPTPCVAKRNLVRFGRELLLGTFRGFRAKRRHCIDLITVRFRPVSGFNSADQGGLEYVIPEPSGKGTREVERKLGVSLFGLTSWNGECSEPAVRPAVA